MMSCAEKYSRNALVAYQRRWLVFTKSVSNRVGVENEKM